MSRSEAAKKGWETRRRKKLDAAAAQFDASVIKFENRAHELTGLDDDQLLARLRFHYRPRAGLLAYLTGDTTVPRWWLWMVYAVLLSGIFIVGAA